MKEEHFSTNEHFTAEKNVRINLFILVPFLFYFLMRLPLFGEMVYRLVRAGILPFVR